MTTEQWARAYPRVVASAELRHQAADFEVQEEMDFQPSGSGEHSWLYLQKTGLNTADLQQLLARAANVQRHDVGVSGLKDRRAVTRQWFSVWLPGREDPDWSEVLADVDVSVLQQARHDRKLKRGVHRRNRFVLRLRQLQGDPDALAARLQLVAEQGFPNYFGEQRFGHGGSTLRQARSWAAGGGRRRLSRTQRSLYFSALRGSAFNDLLALRVAADSWSQPVDGDMCALRGNRSVFAAEQVDADLRQRAAAGDVQPALPLPGRGDSPASGVAAQQQQSYMAQHSELLAVLAAQGLTLGWRAARAFPDDFCWEFCDDSQLRLSFSLDAGSYATAMLREVLDYQIGSGLTGGVDNRVEG